MRLKTIILTVAILGALAGIVALVQRPTARPSTDARVGHPLIERSTLENAAKLRLTDQGKTVTLVRQTDGTWRVSNYYDWPADFTKLTRLVDDLTEAKVDRLVTAQPERLARLEFKDTRIEVLDQSDKSLWSVTLGKSAESGGGRFIRFGDEQKAYLTNLAVWLEPEPKSWADPALLKVKPEEIAKFEVSFPPGAPVTFKRTKKDDAWTADATPSGQVVNPDKVSTLLTALGNLHFTDTGELDDPKALAAQGHERTTKLTTFDGQTVTIAFARKLEEKKLKEPVTGNPTTLTASAGKAGDKPADPKLIAPEFETIPAGPVFASITSTNSNAPVNALMKKRTIQIAEYIFNNLPKEPGELFSPTASPAPIPVPTPPTAGAALPPKS